MRQDGRRKVSFGTVFMLILTGVVLIGSLLVLIRLSNGARIDFSRLQAQTVNVAEYNGPKEQLSSGRTGSSGQGAMRATATPPQATAAPTAAPEKGKNRSGNSFTITVAGTCAIEGDLRKDCYYSDVKQYDFSDIMTLIRGELQSDLNIVFVENIVSDDYKASDTVAPEAAGEMLKNAGFNMAACGYSKAWEKKEEGILSTRNGLTERGITPIGIYATNGNRIRITETNGARVCVLQYTTTVSTSTRKSMAKEGQELTVPEAKAELIATDIEKARANGANAVIVLVQWGKAGKAPDKNQQALARKIAEAGADVIIGSGSRIPQKAEYLTVQAGSMERSVLCVWSLGTLLSKDRSSTKRMAGTLLHMTISADGNGGAVIEKASYTPTYTWKYKQDGRNYYRCVPAGKSAPDGMSSDEIKQMEKAAAAVRDVMADTLPEEQAF